MTDEENERVRIATLVNVRARPVLRLMRPGMVRGWSLQVRGGKCSHGKARGFSSAAVTRISGHLRNCAYWPLHIECRPPAAPIASPSPRISPCRLPPPPPPPTRPRPAVAPQNDGADAQHPADPRLRCRHGAGGAMVPEQACEQRHATGRRNPARTPDQSGADRPGRTHVPTAGKTGHCLGPVTQRR